MIRYYSNNPLAFRAWDDKDKIMLLVTRIDFIEHQIDGVNFHTGDGDEYNIPMEDVSMMQLLYENINKLGQDVYEGDIVRYPDETIQRTVTKEMELSYGIKVIGNIFENQHK